MKRVLAAASFRRERRPQPDTNHVPVFAMYFAAARLFERGERALAIPDRSVLRVFTNSLGIRGTPVAALTRD